MSSEGISRQYDKGIAPKYSEASMEHAAGDPGRNFLKSNLDRFPRSSRVADVGCGSGIDLKTAQEMGFTDIVGVEPSAGLRAEAQKLVGSEVEVLGGMFESIPLPDASVDVIISRFAMHYARDVQQAVREVARVLKEGGICIAVVSHPDADVKVPPNPDGTITITIFNGKMPITFPLHTRNEYLGDTFTELFNPNPEIFEYVSTEQDRGVTDPTQPNALCFVATRKSK